MNTRQALLCGGLLVAAVLVFTISLYPSLQERIPIHWNIRGDIDG